MIGRHAGGKTCDDCNRVYAGPAYATFTADECPIWVRDGKIVGDPICRQNVCADCAKRRGIAPDRKDDPR